MFSRNIEVNNKYAIIGLSNEQVGWLDVSVDYLIVVKVDQSI